jgi:outer membrane protein
MKNIHRTPAKKLASAAFVFALFLAAGPGLCEESPAPELVDLEACITIALQKSPELAMARAVGDQKGALVQSSRKDLLPTLSAHYTYTHQPDSVYYPPDEFGYGVTAQQTLYNGKALVTKVKQAETDQTSSQHEINRIINETIYQVYAAYFEVLRGQKLEDEARQSVMRLESHRQDSRDFYDAGLIALNELLQSEVELAQGEQNLLNAENRTAMAKAQLNTLLQRRVDLAIDIVDNGFDAEKKFAWDDIVSSALQSRPEMHRAEMAVQMAEHDVTIKKAPFLPVVTLSASYDKMGDDPSASSFPDWPDEEKTVTASAVWKLWTWQKNKAETIAAEKAVTAAQRALDQIADTITLEARIAYLQMLEAGKKIPVSEKVIEHARENYRINEARYQSQVATSTEVLDAQTLLAQAMRNYYDSIYAYRMSQAAVERAAGKFYQHYVTETAQ